MVFASRSVLLGAVLRCGLVCVRAAPAGAQEVVTQPTVQLPPPLERVLRDYEAAWLARDATRLAALFDDDGFVLSPGAPPVRDRAAIADRYRNAGGPLNLRAIAYAAEDRVAWIIGQYGPFAGRDSGKFVLALRRADATRPWLIAADVDNPDARQDQP